MLSSFKEFGINSTLNATDSELMILISEFYKYHKDFAKFQFKVTVLENLEKIKEKKKDYAEKENACQRKSKREGVCKM